MTQNVFYFEYDLNEKIQEYFRDKYVFFSPLNNEMLLDILPPGWKWRAEQERRQFVIPCDRDFFDPENLMTPLYVRGDENDLGVIALMVRRRKIPYKHNRNNFTDPATGVRVKRAVYYDQKNNTYRYWYPMGKSHDAYTCDGSEFPTAVYKSWRDIPGESGAWGVYFIWHPNGRMAHYSKHKDGKMHGESKNWDENGKLISTEFYVNGHKVDGIKNTVQWLHRNRAIAHLVQNIQSNTK